MPADATRQGLYRFHFLIPNGSNIFMQELHQKTLEYARVLKRDGINIHVEPIDSFDSHKVTGTLAIYDRSVSDGIAIVAPAFPEVRAAIDRLQDRGVHVVTLVSDHPASSRRYFVGIDNVAAGRVAGRLLGRFLPVEPASIAFIAGSLGLRDQADRYAGCLEILKCNFPHLELIPVREGRDDNDRNKAILSDLLDTYPDLAGLYNMGLGNRGLITEINTRKLRNNIVFIGHELTPQTQAALRDNTMDALISQNPGNEIRRAITLLKGLCDGTSETIPPEHIGIDIFMKENLPTIDNAI